MTGYEVSLTNDAVIDIALFIELLTKRFMCI